MLVFKESGGCAKMMADFFEPLKRTLEKEEAHPPPARPAAAAFRAELGGVERGIEHADTGLAAMGLKTSGEDRFLIDIKTGEQIFVEKEGGRKYRYRFNLVLTTYEDRAVVEPSCHVWQLSSRLPCMAGTRWWWRTPSR